MLSQEKFLRCIDKVNTPYTASNRKGLLKNYRQRMNAFSKASNAVVAYEDAGSNLTNASRTRLNAARAGLVTSFSDAAVQKYMPLKYLMAAAEHERPVIAIADKKTHVSGKIFKTALVTICATFVVPAIVWCPEALSHYLGVKLQAPVLLALSNALTAVRTVLADLYLPVGVTAFAVSVFTSIFELDRPVKRRERLLTDLLGNTASECEQKLQSAPVST